MENDKDSNKYESFAGSAIPRGIEVLVKKASVDPEFRKLLLEKRAEAAKEIDLQLDKNEADMLAAIPREQLEKIIQKTKIPEEQKPVFMSSFGKVMLALVIAGTTVSLLILPAFKTAGISPERTREIVEEVNRRIAEQNDVNDTGSGYMDQNTPPVSRGISPDRIIRED